MTPSVRIAFIVLRCLAAGVAFYATAKHPYSFYVLTRWIVFLTCCWGLWLASPGFWPSFAPAYIAVGLVFNPILPFHFQRSTWHTLDIAAGIILLVSRAFTQAPGGSNHTDAYALQRRSVRHGTCFRRRLSAHHAGAAPHSAVAELEVVGR
jgi:hypothetical protein